MTNWPTNGGGPGQQPPRPPGGNHFRQPDPNQPNQANPPNQQRPNQVHHESQRSTSSAPRFVHSKNIGPLLRAIPFAIVGFFVIPVLGVHTALDAAADRRTKATELTQTVNFLPSDTTLPAKSARPTTTIPSTIEGKETRWQKPELPAEPSGSDRTAKLKYDLIKSVITAAGVTSKSISAKCANEPLDMTKDKSVECTVTYEGLTVPFAVEIKGGQYVASYTYRPNKLPLAKEKAEWELLYSEVRYRNDIAAASCDMKAVELVDVAREGAFNCKLTKVDGTTIQELGTLSIYGDVYFTSN